MERLRVTFGHLSSSENEANQPQVPLITANTVSSKRFPDNSDDVVIISALRTAIAKGKRGSFKDTFPDDLLVPVFQAVLKESNVKPGEVQDICVGNVGDPRAAVTARTGQFFRSKHQRSPGVMQSSIQLVSAQYLENHLLDSVDISYMELSLVADDHCSFSSQKVKGHWVKCGQKVNGCNAVLYTIGVHFFIDNGGINIPQSADGTWRGIGIPETVPISAVNRQCSSGLQACMNIAGAIKTGQIDLGIGAGVESMSMHRGQESQVPINPTIFEHGLARDVLIPMGITSENVAEKYGISREKQDKFALTSQQRAAKAQKTGAFDKEIVPVTTKVQDKDGNEHTVTVAKDEGVRPTTLENLLKLKPAFKQGGSTTAGNSSQVSDGAAAVLMARRSEANKRHVPILGVVRGYAVVGCSPDVMGIGPALAIPELLRKTGLTVDDIDVFEINEAFASQAAYCVEKLGIPSEKVNPLGGAIALGHPLGCTGARQIATILHELERRGKRAYGVVSMCMGTGMGAACLLEYPGKP